jgi:hypothetical protein
MQSISGKEIEQTIIDKGLTAPRITPADIDAAIVSHQSHIFPGTTTTVVLLHLKNGFTVLGESACASPENFDAELGERIAYKQAKDKIWQLEGYALKQRLFEADYEKHA